MSSLPINRISLSEGGNYQEALQCLTERGLIIEQADRALTELGQQVASYFYGSNLDRLLAVLLTGAQRIVPKKGMRLDDFLHYTFSVVSYGTDEKMKEMIDSYAQRNKLPATCLIVLGGKYVLEELIKEGAIELRRYVDEVDVIIDGEKTATYGFPKLD